MIDVENIVLSAVVNALSEEYPQVTVFGTRTAVPAKFPCVMVYEVTNSEATDLSTADRIERFTDVGYTVEIYTNDAKKKQTAKEIFNIVDDALRRIVIDEELGTASGLYRTGKNYTFSFNEAEIFILSANYIGRAGEHPDNNSITFYRR